MQVSTPITDMSVSIAYLHRSGQQLVLRNAPSDAMPVTVVLSQQDIRQLLLAMLRPRYLWLVTKSLFSPKSFEQTNEAINGEVSHQSVASDSKHPSPYPW